MREPASAILGLLRAAALLAALAACAGELETPGEALRLLSSDLPEAIVSEPYQALFHAVGGLRPYDFTLVGGSLPPGLDLSGGELRGAPTSTGTFEFTLRVTDANLSSTTSTYQLSVTTPPTPALELNLPQTEVRGRTAVRVRVTDARNLAGLRTELRWDPQRFTLEEGSLTASRQQAALLHEAGPGVLRVDLALLGTTFTGGGDLFTFALLPLEVPATLAVASTTEFASRTGGGYRHEFAEVSAPGVPSSGGTAGPEDDPEQTEDPDEQAPEDQDPDDEAPEDEAPQDEP